MKRIVLAVFGVFVIALAVAIAKRLSADAISVIVGCFVIGASIPVTLLMLYVLSRREADSATQQRQAPPYFPPPNVTINHYHNERTLYVSSPAGNRAIERREDD